MTGSIDRSAGGKPILIFPGGMPRSLEYLERCRRDRQPVIGASSLPYDSSRDKYSDWTFLPYVTEPGFDDALVKAIEDLDLGGIFSPNVVVWNYLSGVLKRRAPHVTLVNASPINTELGGFRTARDHARRLRAHPLPLASAVATKPPMSEIELASLFRHADLIPGMCDHEKFCALYEIARHSISGDIVEIGSWWGKSAVILARLARYFEIGKLLCVDPWSDEHLVQNDEKGLVDVASAQVEAEEALRVFEINLLPYSVGHVNYLRMPSVEGAASYRRDPVARTRVFGQTYYAAGSPFCISTATTATRRLSRTFSPGAISSRPMAGSLSTTMSGRMAMGRALQGTIFWRSIMTRSACRS